MSSIINAKRHKQIIDNFSPILTGCNILLMNNPHDKEHLDLQVQLENNVKNFYGQSCQKARRHQLLEGFIDNRSQYHMSFSRIKVVICSF